MMLNVVYDFFIVLFAYKYVENYHRIEYKNCFLSFSLIFVIAGSLDAVINSFSTEVGFKFLGEIYASKSGYLFGMISEILRLWAIIVFNQKKSPT